MTGQTTGETTGETTVALRAGSTVLMSARRLVVCWDVDWAAQKVESSAYSRDESGADMKDEQTARTMAVRSAVSSARRMVMTTVD